MDVTEAIEKRRAYRSLAPLEVTDELVHDLARHASLSPSCFNNQSWRYVFVHGAEALGRVKEAMSRGNAWTQHASMVIAVCGRKDDDCIIKDREYWLFDIGMATAFLILRATELGLVAHPIAGYDPQKVRDALNVPAEYQIITVILVGRKDPAIKPEMSEWQVEQESTRPERMPLGRFAFHDRWPDDPAMVGPEKKRKE